MILHFIPVLTTWYLEFCQYLFINRWLHTTSLKTIETFICIVLIVAIILSFLDLPMLVIYKFMYPLLSSLVLHFIGAPFLMFSFAYTVKDVIMNNCHGVNIPLVHCQNIFACFYVSTLLSQKSPTTIMILWDYNGSETETTC